MVQTARTPEEIEAAFDLLNENINRAVEGVVKWFVKDIYAKVLINAEKANGDFGSPVLTGRFYRSHRIAIGGKDTTVAPENKSNTPYSPMSPNKADPKIKGFKMGDTIHITNYLDYADRLENQHWSKKTPNGIYEVSVKASVSFFEERAPAILEAAFKNRKVF